MEKEYLDYVRGELCMIAKDSDVISIMQTAGISSADEVTLRQAVGLALPSRLEGVNGNGAVLQEVMRRFMVAKRTVVYEAFQRYLAMRVGESAAGRINALEERAERTAHVVRTRS